MSSDDHRDRPTCMGVVDKALSLEAAGHDVIHLEKGELDFDTPQVIADSAVRALRDGKTRYTTSVGLAELRAAICGHYQRCYGVWLDADQVIVTSGSSPALLTAFLTLLNPGDEVILPAPCYPSYRRLVELCGATPVHVPLRGHGFRYTADVAERAITPATKAIVLNFPNNPLGSAIDRPAIAAFTRLGPIVISDEVYHGLSPGDLADPSVLEVTEQAIVVNSFSKAFAMTGWRLGYLILPPSLVPRARTIHQDSAVSANTFVQWAAIDALANAAPIAARWRPELQRRRDLLTTGLTSLGFGIAAAPSGAFYLFARLPAGHEDSYGFAARLLAQEFVAVTPGPEFGPGCEGYVRFSYAASLSRIGEALTRIRSYLRLCEAAAVSATAGG